MTEAGVGLAEAIASIRSELKTALEAGQKDLVQFRLGPVELEFELEVTKGGGAGGGIKFWVVSFEAKGDVSRAATHRIKLVLQPVDETGQDLRIRSKVSRRPK